MKKEVQFKVVNYFWVASNPRIDLNIFWGDGGTSRSFLEFETLPDMDPETIEKAEFVFSLNALSGTTVPVPMGAYEILEKWDGEKMDYKSRPLVCGAPEGTATVFDSGARYFIDVTALMKSWLLKKQCFGLMLGPRAMFGAKVDGMSAAEYRHPHIRITLK